MSRSLYVIGGPGTGKSTVMRHVVAALGLQWLPDEKVWREIWVNRLCDETGVPRGLSFGKARGTFSGTDALSMSALPRALEYIRETELPDYVLGEGMRLSSPKFLTRLDQVAPLTVVYLSASEETVAERRAGREGDKLASTFVKQARTRAANTAQAMEAFGYRVLRFHEQPCEVMVPMILESFLGERTSAFCLHGAIVRPVGETGPAGT